MDPQHWFKELKKQKSRNASCEKLFSVQRAVAQPVPLAKWLSGQSRVLLYDDDFCNGCITKRCLHLSMQSLDKCDIQWSRFTTSPWKTLNFINFFCFCDVLDNTGFIMKCQRTWKSKLSVYGCYILHCEKTSAFNQEFHQPERKAEDQTISLPEN